VPDYSIPVPRYWRRIGEYYRLEASRCLKCGKVYYPPRARCSCGSTSLEKISLLDGNFILREFTVLHSVPVDFEKQKPIIHGIVENVNMNIRLITQISDVLDISKLHKDIPVEPIFRVVKRDGNIGIICYGTKFRPKSIEGV